MGEELDNEVLGELAKDAESIKECEAIAAKYKARKVYKITVPVGDEDSDDYATAYFRKPNRVEFSAALARQGRDPLGAKEMLLRVMFLEGDKRIYEDDYALFCASLYVNDMVGLVYGDIKKN